MSTEGYRERDEARLGLADVNVDGDMDVDADDGHGEEGLELWLRVLLVDLVDLAERF